MKNEKKWLKIIQILNKIPKNYIQKLTKIPKLENKRQKWFGIINTNLINQWSPERVLIIQNLLPQFHISPLDQISKKYIQFMAYF